MKPVYPHKISVYIFLTTVFVLLLSLLFTTVTNVYSAQSADGFRYAQTVFWLVVTFLGDATFAFAIVFFLLFFLNQKDLSLKLMICTVLCLMLVQGVKNLYSVQSPQLFFEDGIYLSTNDRLTYKNVISSHAAIGCMLAGFFAWNTKHITLKLLFICCAAAIMFSRMYLVGDSFFTVCLSILPAFLSLYIIKKISYNRTKTVSYYRKDRKYHTQQQLQA